MDAFEAALGEHCAANPAFARVYDAYIDDMMPHPRTWAPRHRQQLIEPPCEDFVKFLLQNGISPEHIAELVRAYSTAELPAAPRGRLLRMLFLYEAAFCAGTSEVRRDLKPCTCAACAVAAGCGADAAPHHVHARRDALELQFGAGNTAYNFHFQEVRTLKGEPVAEGGRCGGWMKKCVGARPQTEQRTRAKAGTGRVEQGPRGRTCHHCTRPSSPDPWAL